MSYAKRQEVLEMLRSTLPISVSYEDPMQWGPGSKITCKRDDLIAMLAVGDDVVADSQWIAALYAEMARFERAALLSAEKADMGYRRWKAQKSAEFRAKAKDKKTQAEVESSYRADKDYEEQSLRPEIFRAQAGVFQGLKEAFAIKAKMLDAAVRNMRSHEQALRTEVSSDRFSDLAQLQREAESAAGASVEAAARIADKMKKQPKLIHEEE
jgi:hypothetical protein